MLGAILHPSSRLYRVYAPSTHSLPSIRPVENPYGPPSQQTELTILSCSSRIRVLRHLSPKFGKIWNKKSRVDQDKADFIDLSHRSFVFVSSATALEEIRVIMLTQGLVAEVV